VGIFGESEPLRDTGHMGVDYDSFRFSKSIAEHHVCRLAADPGQRPEFLHGIGNTSAIFFRDDTGGSADALCLIAKKSGGLNRLFQLRLWSFGVIGRCPVAFE